MGRQGDQAYNELCMRCSRQIKTVPSRCKVLVLLCWYLNSVMILFMLFFGRRCCAIDTLLACRTHHDIFTEKPSIKNVALLSPYLLEPYETRHI